MDGGKSIAVSPGGELVSSRGITFRRTPERVKRSAGDELIDEGSPVVTDVYPEGLHIYEGQDARAAWDEISRRLVVGKPPRVRDLQWIGHVWVSDDGDRLMYFEGHH